MADDLSRWLETYVENRTGHCDEFRKVLSRRDVLEAQFDQVNEHLARMDDHSNEGFEQVDERFERVDERVTQTNDRLDRMNGRTLSGTRWLIGILVRFGTLVTALLSVSQFTG